MVLVLASALGVRFQWQPLRLGGAVAAVLLGSAFFASLYMTIAGLVRTRDRLMGIGQAITHLNREGGPALEAGPVLVAPARAGSPAGVAGCRSTAR